VPDLPNIQRIGAAAVGLTGNLVDRDDDPACIDLAL
jgi:hypothetical protein